MNNSPKDNIFVANIIYKAAIGEEEKWRREKRNEHDIVVADELLNDIRKLGYSYKYLADITNRDNTDRVLLSVVLGYIGRFQDEGISAELVGVVGKKGNTWATEVILKNYIASSEENKRQQAAFYDNALEQIKDKRYLSTYMELLKKPEDAIKLPLTMIMLGRWKCEEAKTYFLNYLNSDILYLNHNISDLVFISLEALSYYDDPDGIILQAFENKLNSSDKDLITATKKAIKRLKRRNVYMEKLIPKIGL